MKKEYIENMETERKEYLIKLNRKLSDKLQNDLYEMQMYQQLDDSESIMNKEALKAIEYHDNYSSFFYTLKDWRKFIINIDPDYLTEEARKIYDKIIEKIDVIDSMDCYNKNYDSLYNWLEEKTKIVLKDIEEYLHSYEEYPTIEESIQYADETDQLTGYYIEVDENGKSDNVIRYDVSYTECYI